MTVHGDLLRAISPATPDTIRASQVMKNKALKIIAALGFLGFAFLILGTLLLEPTSTRAAVDSESAKAFSFANNALADVLIRLSGAILGAAFYAFWTAREYLRDGTFNRQYSQVYLIRFGLGVVAGFILGSIVGESDQLSGAAEKFGPFTLSIVGGFSAEAVVHILQRIADILVAAVRGSDKERVKADAQRETAKRMNDTAAKLQDALHEKSPKAVEKSVQIIVSDMLKR